MTDAQTNQPSAGALLGPVLADLADVIGSIGPDQRALPTPCAEYDVETLRKHVLGWLTFIAAAAQDPAGEGERPDPQTVNVPAGATEGAALVRESAARIAEAVGAGVEDGPVKVVQMSMPGQMAFGMMLWEFLMHGSDLARATGHAWSPDPAAAEVAWGTAQGMLSDEYRGAGKDFGEQVPVPDDAPMMDRLLGFSGRDPYWKP